MTLLAEYLAQDAASGEISNLVLLS